MLETVTYARKIQTKSPSRKRLRLPSIVDGDPAASLRGEEEVDSAEEAVASVFDEASSSSSCFASEVTFESAPSLARSKHPRKQTGSATRPRKTDQTVKDHPNEEFRRITRSYAKRKEKLWVSEAKVGNRGGWFTFFPDSSGEAIINFNHRDASTVQKENSVGNAFSGFTTSEMSDVSGEFCDENRNGVSRSRVGSHEAPEISDSPGRESISMASSREFAVSSYVSQRLDQSNLARVADLACSENLSNSEDSPNDSCRAPTLSEFGSDLLHRSSKGVFSGYTSSLVYESSDDCLERPSENSAPSFLSLFLSLGSEFCPSSSPKESSEHEDEYAHEFTLLRFESRDDEESYEMFRSRERSQAMLHDYTEEYSSRTDFGDLIIHQRLVMVNWMVEHANIEELQCETLFLGVSLMDRFLSRGFFKTERNLKLLGIACIILATRLEENQPYNCVRQKSFYVRGITYSRCEVVAMEWFVQEVLNFQCLHLTSFNFLWFYLKAAKANVAVEKLAKYLAVLSLLDHERLTFWPSTVAAGVVILASLATDQDDSCNRVMETHVRTRNDDLSECIQSLEWLVKYAY
ncbi:unnamed protein product [Spirodela intermedia]|uniref:Uncharacterized protein n=1 Tax=Spirodela intermedia TaxID=51605 RepID=A0A7I8IDP0_SPIIN|nr:unnamed protein product [Spirodela intermedia]CAA6655937.1 unnamed protein product [Spirodela intermedia]